MLLPCVPLCWSAMYHAIVGATREVLIADWWLSPEVFLLRPSSKHPDAQLATLLRAKAEQVGPSTTSVSDFVIDLL